MLRKFRLQNLEDGFTLVELLVVIAITLVLTGTIIANLRAGERTSRLRTAGDSVQSALRLMQNNALSGTPHPSGAVALDFGWQINTTQTTYLTFAEEAGPSNKTTIETVKLPASIIMQNLIVGGQAATTLEVRFSPPFGQMTMTGGTYSGQKNLIATFELLYSGTTKKRTVTIDGISGRINVQ